jgi:hypothetical protein
MWKNLESLHLKKNPKSIFMLEARFFDYKMTASDDISSHIQNINEMAMELALQHWGGGVITLGGGYNIGGGGYNKLGIALYTRGPVFFVP